MSVVIEVDNLSFSYSEDRAVLKELCVEVAAEEFLAVAGPNGAGKTTLLNLLCGLLRADSGSIKINGHAVRSYSVKKLATQVAFVRQEFVPVFDFTAAEVVSMARTCHLPALGFETQKDKEIVADALEITDTAGFADRPLSQLSAGERQRVFIARAIAQETPILLLDEPTSFLDLKHQVEIFDLLKKMQLEKSKTIVAITHDINLAGQYCDRALLLAADASYQTGRIEEVFSAEKIEKTFGVTTFNAPMGKGNFFMPLGKLAKDARQ